MNCHNTLRVELYYMMKSCSVLWNMITDVLQELNSGLVLWRRADIPQWPLQVLQKTKQKQDFFPHGPQYNTKITRLNKLPGQLGSDVRFIANLPVVDFWAMVFQLIKMMRKAADSPAKSSFKAWRRNVVRDSVLVLIGCTLSHLSVMFSKIILNAPSVD